jgi:hypothetical protein
MAHRTAFRRITCFISPVGISIRTTQPTTAMTSPASAATTAAFYAKYTLESIRSDSSATRMGVRLTFTSDDATFDEERDAEVVLPSSMQRRDVCRSQCAKHGRSSTPRDKPSTPHDKPSTLRGCESGEPRSNGAQWVVPPACVSASRPHTTWQRLALRLLLNSEPL